jgi:hypothetical protein
MSSSDGLKSKKICVYGLQKSFFDHENVYPSELYLKAKNNTYLHYREVSLSEQVPALHLLQLMILRHHVRDQYQIGL